MLVRVFGTEVHNFCGILTDSCTVHSEWTGPGGGSLILFLFSRLIRRHRWTTGTRLMTSPFSALSLSVLRHRAKRAHHVKRPCTQWRNWWPTTSFFTTRAFVASTATPNSVWDPTLPCRGSSTASRISSSSSRVKETMMRASVASSIRSSGPPRMRRASPRHHNLQ